MFDLIVGLTLIISAFAGFLRGATRELVAVVSFILAVVVSVLALRLTFPLTLAAIHIAWLAKGLALLIGFVAAFILFRLLGGSLAKKIHDVRALGTLDRVIGVGFGLIRALVLVGMFNLLLTAVTPPDRMPPWVTEAKLYPLTKVGAGMLRAIAPKGFSVAGSVGSGLGRAVAGEDESVTEHDSVQDTPGNWGYDARNRKSVEKPEKSR
jgi:membrane protein required for colicin V production